MDKTWVVRLQAAGGYAGSIYNIHEIQFADLTYSRPRVNLLRDGLIVAILNPGLIKNYELWW